MRLLLDASGAEAWIGLAEGGVITARASSTVRASHGEALLPLLVEVLGSHRPSELEGIVAGVGPGSFTGIRVALATALGLRRACGTPIVTVDTFECLMAQATDPRAASIVTVPALPGEVYAEAWDDGRASAAAIVVAEADLPTDRVRVTGAITLESLLDASRGKSPVDVLLPRYVAPPKITLPTPR